MPNNEMIREEIVLALMNKSVSPETLIKRLLSSNPVALLEAIHNPQHLDTIKRLYIEGNRIKAIKKYRDLTGLPLMESKKIVDSWAVEYKFVEEE